MEQQDVVAGQELDNSQARTPTAGVPEPPLPSTPAPTLSPNPGQGSGPRGWRKFFAIMGIVFAFPFLFTIPGWVALSAYRRWKWGERGQPTWLIVWGIVSFIVFWPAFAVGLVGVPVSFTPVDSSGPPTVSPTVSKPMVNSPPPGFTSSELNNQWTRYISRANRFSIALPPGWQPNAETVGSHMKFRAEEADPPYLDRAWPQVFVMRWPANPSFSLRDYSRDSRLRLAHDPRTVGTPQVTTTSLPNGLAYVINNVERSRFGRASYTRYGLLKGDVLFLIVFVVPTPYAGDYPDVFDDIAHTFALTTDVTP